MYEELMEVVKGLDCIMTEYGLNKKKLIKIMIEYIDFEYEAKGEIEKKINEILKGWVK